MTRRAPKRPHAIDEPGFSALVEFARAYLHEDLVHEYGSALGAAAAFAADANPDERRRVADALDREAAAVGDVTGERLTRLFLKDLRSAWAPASAADLRELAAAVRGSVAPPETTDRRRRSKSRPD